MYTDKSAYQFVNDRKDQLKRSATDAYYDPSTLYIPPDDLRQMKNMERQYWDIKRDNFDVIIFFKKGKFYELYDTDAELAAREFGLRIVNNVRATGMMMSGVPEVSFTTWSQRFIQRGYKVGRVEQMPREKPDDFIKRELVRVYSLGTLNDTDFIHTSDAIYVCAVFENTWFESDRLSACAIDCSRSKGYYCLFEGPERYLQLKTFLYHLSPREIVIQQSANVSRQLNNIVHEYQSENCFLRWISIPEKDTASNDPGVYLEEITKSVASIPSAWSIKLQEQPVEIIIAFWLLFRYLENLHLAAEAMNAHLSIERFSLEGGEKAVESCDYMILDCHTLEHLNIVPIEVKASTHLSGKSVPMKYRSLFERIDHTLTSAGKRLLKTWILNPLVNRRDLINRQDSVKAFMRYNAMFNETISNLLEKCPANDLERSSWKLRVLTDEKNVSWIDADIQGKKIADLLQLTLGIALAYTELCETVLGSKEISETAIGSALYNKIPSGLQRSIETFRNTYLSTGESNQRPSFYGSFIVPSTGSSEVLDTIDERTKQNQVVLDEKLRIAREAFGDEVEYVDFGKDRYIFEIPKKNYFLSAQYLEFNSTANVVRVYDPECKRISKWTENSEETRNNFYQEYLKKVILGEYASLHLKIVQISQIVASIDAINSIAKYSDQPDMCCPEILAENGIFEATSLFYPETKILGADTGRSIVHNDVSFNQTIGKTIILTGPNMGGKSTLMRSIADACLLAQIGAYVTATTLKLSPMDRIYTRIGAKDAMFQGKSTFLVELLETAHILQKATPNSLVLVDELGRGTSTLDGYSIAWGALLHLVERNCFMLFSTHYYFLAIEALVSLNGKVRAMQMGYQLRGDDGHVVLLHKLIPGVCSSAYGLEVARQAGIPKEIIDRAEMHGERIAHKLGFDDATMNEQLIGLLMEKLKKN